MKNLDKTGQIASVQGKNRLERRNPVQEMLIAYRSTPHPATEVAPYEALKGTPVRTKLYYTEPETQRNVKDDITDQRDAQYKQKTKQQREGRKTRENNLLLRDNFSSNLGGTSGVHPMNLYSTSCAAFVVLI